MTPVTGIGYAAALLLATAFAWAGAAKLRAPAATAAAFGRLRLRTPRLLAVTVPPGELLLAVILTWRPRAGGLLALLALAAFSILLGARLRAGAQVGCGCFGAGGGQPISAVELARNGLLAMLAGAALLAPEPATPGLDAVIAVTTAAAIGLVFLALLDVRLRLGRLWDNRLEVES